MNSSSMSEKIRNMSKDFLLNICATMILIASMQFFVYPQIAKVCSAEAYGVFLTIIGAVNTLGGTFGNSLNNVRLIMNETYHNEGVIGDFNILIKYSIYFNLFALGIFAIYSQISIEMSVCIVLLFIFTIVRNYYNVAYRLNINYYRILMMNCILAGAYVVMTVWYVYVNNVSDYWFLIFFVGEIFVLVYLIKTTDLWREPFVKTRLYKITWRKYLNLIYLSFVGGILLYFDRNLLLPLLGGEAVSIYFAATIVGKAFGMFAGPVSGVLLSYLGQVGFKMSRRLFWKINVAICGIALCCYVVTLFVVDWAVQFLYPGLYFFAKPYFLIANLVPVFTVVGDLARPTVLRYVELSQLSVFNTVFLVVTCIVSYLTITMNGLLGFCWGAAGLALVRVFVMWFLGDWAMKKQVV